MWCALPRAPHLVPRTPDLALLAVKMCQPANPLFASGRIDQIKFPRPGFTFG
jgi:hypothetical protein